MGKTDQEWMQQALILAQKAWAQNEVPIGAVMVQADQQIGEGYNQCISLHDISAHAEIMALRAAGQQLQNYRFPQATLYVTLEPCPMCVGALIAARVKRVVYGAADPKTGALGGAIDLQELHGWNHNFQVEGHVLGEACGELLRDFFKQRR